jgi:DNA repair exonuclease SbcCD nuclease subunit
MISLACLQKPNSLTGCPLCSARQQCDAVREVISKLAKSCGIDTTTGEPQPRTISGFDIDTRHDLFQDTLRDMEKGVATFSGNCKLSTWAFQILSNKKNDLLRKKYAENNLFQYQPGAGNDDENQNWDEWSSGQHRDPAVLNPDTLIHADITTAFQKCYERILLINKECAGLLIRVYSEALRLVKEDADFEHHSTGSINFTKILKIIAHEYAGFDALKRRYYRCREELDRPLRQCLEEMGYGDF